MTKEVALPAGARTSEGMSKGGVDKLDGALSFDSVRERGQAMGRPSSDALQ